MEVHRKLHAPGERRAERAHVGGRTALGAVHVEGQPDHQRVRAVALDRAGRVLIADTENHCIRRYDPGSETITTVAGVPTKAGAAIGADLRSTRLARPHGCRISPDGRLVIADSDNDRILAGPAD